MGNLLACPSPDASLKFEHQDRASLWHNGVGAQHLVDAVLNAFGVETPAGSDSDILFAIDLKGSWNSNYSVGCWEAPQLITRAGIERSELSIGGTAGKNYIAARNQERCPKDRLEVVLPNSLASIQVPGLQFPQVIGSACARTD